MKSLKVCLATIIMSFALVQNAFAEITFPNSVYSNLDYGLYWFDSTDHDLMS